MKSKDFNNIFLKKKAIAELRMAALEFKTKYGTKF